MAGRTDKDKSLEKTSLIDHERGLVDIAPKDTGSYEDESLAALTAYSLYWLHRWKLRRTIEAVTVLNWRLFPTKFSMMGFLQFPDAFRTNRSLMQGQPKYRNWLTGNAKRGFSLNENGHRLAERLAERLGPPALSDGTELGDPPKPTHEVPKKARTIEPARVVRDIKKSMLFDQWVSEAMSDRDLIHVHSMLGVFDHTPVAVRKRKMKDLEQAAKDVEDQEVLRFLDDVRQEFPKVFSTHSKK